MSNVTFDPPKLARLADAYAKACLGERKSFAFEGQEYVTQYAKYLIEYLTRVIEKEGR